jgi:hypothetical protein
MLEFLQRVTVQMYFSIEIEISFASLVSYVYLKGIYILHKIKPFFLLK